MAEVVNLRAKRKAAARKTARAQADGNAVKFGRSKAERAKDTAQTEKSTRDLDGHKRGD